MAEILSAALFDSEAALWDAVTDWESEPADSPEDPRDMAHAAAFAAWVAPALDGGREEVLP